MMLRQIVVIISGTARRVEIERHANGRVQVRIGGREATLEGSSDGTSWVDAQGRVFRVDAAPAGKDWLVQVGAAAVTAQVEDEDRRLLRTRNGVAAQAHGAAEIRAPMPGRILRVGVRPGDRVSAGQALVVVEAMKMENELRTDRAGTVRDVWAREGQAVEAGEKLVRID